MRIKQNYICDDGCNLFWLFLQKHAQTNIYIAYEEYI